MSPREWANVLIRRPEVKRESVFLTVPPDVPRAWLSMPRQQRSDGGQLSFPVRDSGPSDACHGIHFISREEAPQTPVQVLIQQNFHRSHSGEGADLGFF